MEKCNLKWEEYYDDDDNTYYEAVGMAFEEGDVFHYRIRRKLRFNKILFTEDSDPELLLDPKSIWREEWTHLEDAKYEMNRHYQELMKNYDNTRSL